MGVTPPSAMAGHRPRLSRIRREPWPRARVRASKPACSGTEKGMASITASFSGAAMITS